MKHANRMPNRRTMLRLGTGALSAAVWAPATRAHNNRAASRPASSVALPICLFSKPLHNRPFAELPAVLREIGFGAVDLTCRPQGHVLPERVADDLPRACELFQAAGIAIPMITTEITDAGEGNAPTIIETASKLGIRHIKLGYYRYGDLRRIRETLAEVKSKLRDVVALCRQFGVQAGFHNHCGRTVGAAMWDVWELIRDLPEDAIGSYFDIRHATVEGGDGGWQIGLNLLAPRIVMLAIKDFSWRKDPQRGWRPENVPLGEGMAHCEEALKPLQERGFRGPISLHMEYVAENRATPPVGSEDDAANLRAIRHDHRVLTDLLQRAGFT